MKHPWLSKGAAAAVAVMLLSACAGPTAKINASMREFPQNVRIGDAAKNAAAIAPIPPTASPLSDGIYLPPARQTRSTTPAADAPCAPAKLGTTALLPVGVQPDKPPAPGLYEFRTQGKHTVGGASATVVDYPSTGRRLVGAARPAGLPGVTAYDFEVIVELDDNRTDTLYRIIPKAADDVTQQQNPLPGLYVMAVATLDSAYHPTAQFTPQPPMKVMPFPAFAGQTFQVASADPTSGVAVTYRCSVGSTISVDACGQIVEARRVNHIGSITVGGCGAGPCAGAQATTTTFKASYDFALQYGGIAVQDHVTIAGGALDAPYGDDLSGVINRVPKQPA